MKGSREWDRGGRKSERVWNRASDPYGQLELDPWKVWEIAEHLRSEEPAGEEMCLEVGLTVEERPVGMK